jgi:hypothetical protein
MLLLLSAAGVLGWGMVCMACTVAAGGCGLLSRAVSWLWTAMMYMSAVERYSGWRQLCVHAQPCMQGSGDAACLLCLLGAVYFDEVVSASCKAHTVSS